MERISKDKYFMGIAKLAAKRGSCNRAQVGAVLVKNSRIIATGYNGAISGGKRCDEIGHIMDKENNHCLRTVHAETNCIIQAAKMGIACDGSVIYVTHYPCHNCIKILINAGVKKIYYINDYNDGYNKRYGVYVEVVKLD